jgi:hypothetical protein
MQISISYLCEKCGFGDCPEKSDRILGRKRVREESWKGSRWW